MKLNTFYKLYPDFVSQHAASGGTDSDATYGDVLAGAPFWLFRAEWTEWCDADAPGGGRGPMIEFAEDAVPDADVPGLVRRVREALGRQAPAPTVCRYKREMLAPELLAVAYAAVSEGETYAPLNAWALALFQAAELADGKDRSDEIAVCCAQYERLEGRPICSKTPDVWDVRAE